MTECVIRECRRPAPVYTLCDVHRVQFGVTEKRPEVEPPAPRDNPLPPAPNRPPRVGRRRHVKLTEAQIEEVREAYRTTTYRWLGYEIGLSHHAVRTIVYAVPGDPVEIETYNLLVRWMRRRKYGEDFAA